VLLDRFGDPGGSNTGADDEDGAIVVTALAHIPCQQPYSHHSGQQEEGCQHDQQKNPQPADLVATQQSVIQAQGIDDHHQQHGRGNRDPKNVSSFLVQKDRSLGTIELRAVQQKPPDCQGDRQ